MRRFADLYDALDATTATNEKVAAMRAYFAEAPPADAAWAMFFLTGARLKRLIAPRLLAVWGMEETETPDWMLTVSVFVTRLKLAVSEPFVARFTNCTVTPLHVPALCQAYNALSGAEGGYPNLIQKAGLPNALEQAFSPGVATQIHCGVLNVPITGAASQSVCAKSSTVSGARAGHAVAFGCRSGGRRRGNRRRRRRSHHRCSRCARGWQRAP